MSSGPEVVYVNIVVCGIGMNSAARHVDSYRCSCRSRGSANVGRCMHCMYILHQSMGTEARILCVNLCFLSV